MWDAGTGYLIFRDIDISAFMEYIKTSKRSFGATFLSVGPSLFG